uniref:Uncharacterized protein n=1 Tax=Triticum urartu TaxID=4572 RepID=A0A8R7PE92_TRIUA
MPRALDCASRTSRRYSLTARAAKGLQLASCCCGGGALTLRL